MPESIGGLELHLYRLAKEISKHSQIKIFCRKSDLNKEDYTTEDVMYDGIEIRKINNTLRDFNDFRMIYINDKIEKEFERYLDLYQPDVVDIHHLSCLSTTIIRSIKKRKIPIVLTLHDYWMICPKGQRLKDDDLTLCEKIDRKRCTSCLRPTLSVRKGYLPGFLRRFFPAQYKYQKELSSYDKHITKMLSMTDIIITPTEFLKGEFVSYGVRQEKVKVIGHGLQSEPFEDFIKTPAKKIRFGFIGSVIPSKGVHILVEAFNKFRRDDISLSIHGKILPFHGDTGYGERLKAMIRPGADVTFHGGYENQHLTKILSEIDVLVVPSIWHETFSIVIREGFLAGIPVIASNIGAMEESIQHGQTGLLFECGSSNDLFEKTKMLVENEELRKRLSNNDVKAKNMQENAQEIADLYKELIQNRKKYLNV